VGIQPQTDRQTDRHTDRQTHRQTDTQTRITTIHFATSTTHAKCNDLQHTDQKSRKISLDKCVNEFLTKAGETMPVHSGIAESTHGLTAILH